MHSRRTNQDDSLARQRPRGGRRPTTGPLRPPGKDGHRRVDRTLDDMLAALSAVREGDFTVRLPADEPDGQAAEIARVFNDVVSRNDRLAGELARLARVIAREGQLGER